MDLTARRRSGTVAQSGRPAPLKASRAKRGAQAAHHGDEATSGRPDAVARLRAGEAPAAVAIATGLSRSRVYQLQAQLGIRGAAGRPRTAAATPRTARGRALLARLVADAAAAGVEPEVYLERLGAIDRAVGAVGRLGANMSGDDLRRSIEAISNNAGPRAGEE